MCVREADDLIVFNIMCDGVCTLQELQEQYASNIDLLQEIDVKIGGFIKYCLTN